MTHLRLIDRQHWPNTPQRILGALQISQNTDGPLQRDFRIPHCLVQLCDHVMRAVAHVQAEHIHAGFRQLQYDSDII